MRDSLWFREVRIRRMPGFPSGGIGVTGLCAGINLIRGLNASGKTTTARALQALLWQGATPERASLEGRFRLGGEAWLVDVDGSRVLWQREGRDASPPPLPPAEHRSRYYLSLHELLRAEDRELAEHVRVEMHAGYDVPGAAERLGFGAGGRKRSLVDALRDARRERTEAADAAEGLRQDRRELNGLRRDLERLEARAAEARTLERALELARAQEALVEAERRVSGFPGAMGSLSGDEPERLERWAKLEEEHRSALAAACRQASAAEAVLEETGLGADPPARAVLRELEERTETVREIEGVISRSEDAVAEARAARKRADRELGVVGTGGGGAEPDRDHEIDEDTDPGLDPDLPGSLDRFLRHAERLRGERASLEARLAELEASDAYEGDPEEKLQAALRVLREWLRAPVPASEGDRLRDRLLLVSTVALLAAGPVALASGFGEEPASWPLMGAGALATLTALGVVGTLVLRPERAKADPRAALEDEAERLSHAPREWTPRSVKEAVDRLERAVVRRREAEAREKERAALRSRRRSLEEAEASLEAERTRLAEELGVRPPPEDLALHALASRLLVRDRAAHDEAEETGRLRSARDRLDAELARVREIVRPFGYDPRDGHALAGVRAELSERCEARANAQRDLDEARDAASAAERGLEGVAEDRRALFDQLDLHGEDPEAELRGLARKLEEYRGATKDRDGACRDRERAAAALRDFADGGGPAATELLRAWSSGSFPPPDPLERRLEEARDASRKARELGEEIARVEERLDEARHQDRLEEALAREDEARAKLEEQRARDIEDEIGRELAEWIRSRSATENHPAVFNRARELLVQITRGRYELQMSEGDPADFRAFDNDAGRGRALDELSAGTRLQLLLAVRMAFVETLEAGAAPPLLLDEVLANSDSHRARAIIDACIALAEGGRQIFYFTAQADELAKWRAALERSEVAWVETGLADAAGDGGGFRWTASPVEADELPAPTGRSIEEYGRSLDVPPFDPRADGVGGLHLWYLLEDADVLYELLRLGISTWGQLATFSERAGASVPEAVRRAAGAARARSELCRRFVELRRRGRGRPVDRAVLLESGAVSEAFIDEVADLCRELEGRGSALVEALEEGRVSRFRSRMIDKLRSFLVSEGHISGEEVLTDEAILLELTAEAQRLGARLDSAEIHALVDRLARGPVAGPPA